MKLFVFIISICIMFLGCSGTRASPDDVRKILCSISPAAYDTAILLCEKIQDKKRRDECLTAVSMARAGQISLCELQSHSRYKTMDNQRCVASIEFHQLE